MRSDTPHPQPLSHKGKERSGGRELKWFGAGLCFCCILYIVLLQSSTLWSRPTGLEGVFWRFRDLFTREWLDAPRTSELGLLNSGLYLLLLVAMFGIYWAALRHAFRRGKLSAE